MERALNPSQTLHKLAGAARGVANIGGNRLPAPAARPSREALAQRIAALEHELEYLRSQLRDEQDTQLLRVTADSVGDLVFSAAELVAHARVDDQLRDALEPHPNAHTIGKRLRRIAANRSLVGFTLRFLGRDEAGCLWQIVRHADR